MACVFAYTCAQMHTPLCDTILALGIIFKNNYYSKSNEENLATGILLVESSSFPIAAHTPYSGNFSQTPYSHLPFFIF